MQELISDLPKNPDISYLLDTCFFVDVFRKNKVKKLINFCQNNVVGMSSFNFHELLHIHHNFPGQMNHHMRNFLKEKILSHIIIDVKPGNRELEQSYVKSFDHTILKVIPDPSDAVLFVLALRHRADILTKDSHHIFTAAAENYAHHYKVNVWNEFP